MSIPRERELADLANYAFQDRNEADVRADWIDPLLRLLGYGLGTRNRIRREEPLDLSSSHRAIGSKRVQIDYIPTIYNKGLWIIEAKRPQRSLFASENLGQAWTYATDPRIRAPLMMLCDGDRIGVFDLTQVEWDEPVLDMQRSELPARFEELNSILGARRVAEAVRVRQLEHLRIALEAQIDLEALDATVARVRQMVEAARPVVTGRRREILDSARREATVRGEAAVDNAGIWGLAQHVNRPTFLTRMDLSQAVAMVRRQSPLQRVAEFSQFEKATSPRRWFAVKVLEMSTALALSQDDGCSEHCTDAARRIAHEIATGFSEDPVMAASYELQQVLGPLGWKWAAVARSSIEEAAASLRAQLETEEWLKMQGEYGVETADQYQRVAMMLPSLLFHATTPWDVETIRKRTTELTVVLESLNPPVDHEGLQPAGDPFLDSWRTTDPALTLARAVVNEPPVANGPDVSDLADELRGTLGPTSSASLLDT